MGVQYSANVPLFVALGLYIGLATSIAGLPALTMFKKKIRGRLGFAYWLLLSLYLFIFDILCSIIATAIRKYRVRAKDTASLYYRYCMLFSLIINVALATYLTLRAPRHT